MHLPHVADHTPDPSTNVGNLLRFGFECRQQSVFITFEAYRPRR